MADDHLRELERTWRSSGVLEDGIRWHRARLRAGVVDRDGLRREAADGDRAAWAAVDDVPSVVLRLDAWLRRHGPGKLSGFNPPATEAELAETEEALGQPLPPLLRALYLWRNGQPRAWPGGLIPDVDPPEELDAAAEDEAELLGFALDPPQEDDQHLSLFPANWRLLSLREVRAAWEARVWQPVVAGEEGDDVVRWPARCLPFMVQGGGYLRCIDPSGGGLDAPIPGHVVEGFGQIEVILAPSLEHWLETFVAALERRVWTVDGENDRLDYFARAVTPGYPRVVIDDVAGTMPAKYDESPRDMVEHFTTCSGCLSCLGCGPGLVIALITILFREGWGLFSSTTLSALGTVIIWIVGISAAIALPTAIWIYAAARIRHRRHTREFEGARLEDATDASLAEPGVDPIG